jgi:hypothetical protein
MKSANEVARNTISFSNGKKLNHAILELFKILTYLISNVCNLISAFKAIPISITLYS